MTINLIDKYENLVELCDSLKSCNHIAIDTEFKRETTYFPLPCLIQLASENTVACVDPISIKDLSPLKEILLNKNILKIFHACRQDLEIFYYMFNQVPKPIYDSQIAAPLIGLPENIGYATLVENYFSIKLDKSLTRANWETRPLKTDLIEYAANDVIFLLKTFHKQKELLTNANRLHWLDEEFENQTKEELYKPSPDNAWKKIKSFHKLTEKQQQICFSLTKWRENISIAQNIPRTFVLKNNSILDIIYNPPKNKEEIFKVKNLRHSIAKKYHEELLSIIMNSNSLKQFKSSQLKNSILDETQKQLLKKLQKFIEDEAIKLNISKTFLCPKKEIEKLILIPDESILTKGWRYEVVGENILKLLQTTTHDTI